MKFLILFALLFAPVTLLASHCGAGLAAEDLAGNCRKAPFTPGALEAASVATPLPTPTPQPASVPAPAPKPSKTTIITLLPSWSADFSPNGRGDWKSHCAGINSGIVCRYVASFPTAKLPKDKPITALRLRIPVTYVTTGLSTGTWRIGLYGVVGNNPQSDENELAFVRAMVPVPWVKASACCRTVATKDVILTGTPARADLANAIAAGAPFVIAIRMNGDTASKVPNKFAAAGRFNTPAAPSVLVTFKN